MAWSDGFRWREHDGPDRGWLEAISQVLTHRSIAGFTLAAVLLNTILILVALYLIVVA